MFFKGGQTKRKNETPEQAAYRVEMEQKYSIYNWKHQLNRCIKSGWFNKPNMTPFESVFYAPFQSLLEYLELETSVS